jgi:hypothetical protein
MRNVIALMMLVGAMGLAGCAEKKPAPSATPAPPATTPATDPAKPAETPAK